MKHTGKRSILLRELIIISILLLGISACKAEEGTQEVEISPDKEPTASTPSDETGGGEEGSLDLREANVVDVSFEDLGSGSHRFNVTLHHDDDGESPKYADFWQVEDLEGTVLGKRVLTHSHGSEPFTRSETITIPADISTVIVRGHDMTHGFGGQAMKVDLGTGQTEPFQEDNLSE